MTPSPSRLGRAAASLLALALLAAAPVPALAQGDEPPEPPVVGIVGGDFAAPGQFPWMVALVDANTTKAEDGIFCGGAVIAPRVVVTAAHCFDDGTGAEGVDVVAGRTTLSDRTDGERVNATSVVVHEDYDPQTAHNDIALIQLEKPVTITPIAQGTPALAKPGVRVTSAGWGTTAEGGAVSDALKRVKMRLRSGGACAKRYGEDFVSVGQICAGARAAGQDTCQGDSGGPLFRGSDANAKLLGIVSYGEGCGRKNIPGVYTRTTAYAGWLKQHVTALNGGAVVPPSPPKPRVRIGAIRCGVKLCTVQLRVTGGPPAGGIRVDAKRAKRGKRKAIHRRVFATRTAPGRWTARVNLPLGRVVLYATPLDEPRRSIAGAGDVQRLDVTRG